MDSELDRYFRGSLSELPDISDIEFYNDPTFSDLLKAELHVMRQKPVVPDEEPVQTGQENIMINEEAELQPGLPHLDEESLHCLLEAALGRMVPRDTTVPVKKNIDIDLDYLPGEPAREEPAADPEPEQSAPGPKEETPDSTGEYRFPPLDLLRRSDPKADEEADRSRELENAIHRLGLTADVIGSGHGPTVSYYEIQLPPGTRLSRITGMSADIAFSLGVTDVRIAPVPGKPLVAGIEVPNEKPQTVRLGDIIGSQTFAETKSNVSVALGRDANGRVQVGNIAKMPHVVIAGASGSGKSVCIHSFILSILYKARPDEVKFIMVDPKMVELGIYNGLPHMFIPVVKDVKKAAGTLQWAVVEMLRRCRLFSEVGVRDLDSYNEVRDPLPRIVIIIDELEDLMAAEKKDVEGSICRIASRGHTAGIHLVIATQHPTANILTGPMKTDIPSRIAFAVSGESVSSLILDRPDAEKLLGWGDMLYRPHNTAGCLRIQGAFVSDAEKEAVINFIRAQGECEYDDEVVSEMNKNDGGDFAPSAFDGGGEYNELPARAMDVIFETGLASTSMLQRRLKLGYSRAGRLIDQLEEKGWIGPYQGSKPRSILITKQQWQEIRQHL